MDLDEWVLGADVLAASMPLTLRRDEWPVNPVLLKMP